MKYKVGDKYYYNNGQVEILKIETEEFVLVCGIKDVHTEITGSQFCEACMIGGMASHTCEEVDYVVKDVVGDISDKDIFWVNVKHLQDKPFEYKEWEKIKKENGYLEEANERLKQEAVKLNEENMLLKKETTLLEYRKEQLCDSIESKEKEEKEKLEIIKHKDRVIEVKDYNIKITLSDLLDYIEGDIKLEHLENGGVDNWEWYGECLPDNEVIKSEAIKRMAVLIKG